MSGDATLIDRCVLGVDIQSYSTRSVRRQRDAQRALPQLLADAAGAAGLDRETWEPFHTGDGELTVLPADVNLLAVIGRFIPELHGLLQLRNEDHAPATAMRLRVAVHIDALTSSTPGRFAGPALVVLSRLLDSQAVRRALTQATSAELALILSAPVHDKVVTSGFLAHSDHDFARVRVDVPGKDFDQVAYVHVPGHDMRTFPTEQLEDGVGPTGATAGGGDGDGDGEPYSHRDRRRSAREEESPDESSTTWARSGSIVVGGDWVQGSSPSPETRGPER